MKGLDFAVPMTGVPDARVIFARVGVVVTRRPDDPIAHTTKMPGTVSDFGERLS